MSCTGTGSIRSTSPASRAATRVPSAAIGVKITSVRLCSGVPHQPGFGLKTVRTPGSWLSITKGPVPLVLKADGPGLVSLAEIGAAAPSASAHSLSIMYQVSHS